MMMCKPGFLGCAMMTRIAQALMEKTNASQYP